VGGWGSEAGCSAATSTQLQPFEPLPSEWNRSEPPLRMAPCAVPSMRPTVAVLQLPCSARPRPGPHLEQRGTVPHDVPQQGVAGGAPRQRRAQHGAVGQHQAAQQVEGVRAGGVRHVDGAAADGAGGGVDVGGHVAGGEHVPVCVEAQGRGGGGCVEGGGPSRSRRMHGVGGTAQARRQWQAGAAPGLRPRSPGRASGDRKRPLKAQAARCGMWEARSVG
jgi:hypothetical protein